MAETMLVFAMLGLIIGTVYGVAHAEPPMLYAILDVLACAILGAFTMLGLLILSVILKGLGIYFSGVLFGV